ncbi:hypothetical protein M0R45_006921 [Rubus argutus]|uniref:Uncharacterized protein n=1 Tax=Rubus argutus TaxID=59490 RepID=A0AAW1YRZ3_RUBAR
MESPDLESSGGLTKQSTKHDNPILQVHRKLAARVAIVSGIAGLHERLGSDQIRPANMSEVVVSHGGACSAVV